MQIFESSMIIAYHIKYKLKKCVNMSSKIMFEINVTGGNNHIGLCLSYIVVVSLYVVMINCSPLETNRSELKSESNKTEDLLTF